MSAGKGEGVCPVRTFCGQGGDSSGAEFRTFWCKDIGFFEIYGVSARTGGDFSRFCADVPYGRPLTISEDA